MNQSLKLIRSIGIAFITSTACEAGVLSDENLRIGSGHTLTENDPTYGYDTYNSISAGFTNKNQAYLYSLIGCGQYNSILGQVFLTTTTNASNPSPDSNQYSQSSLIAAGENNVLRSRVSTIGGGEFNYIYATNKIPGNSTNLWWDQVGSAGSVIAGGGYNEILSPVSAIGGGLDNRIGEWATYSVIPGGVNNRIDYASGYSVISGGGDNLVTRGATWGSINGGQANAIYGIIPSGTAIVRYDDFDLNHWGWIGGGVGNVITNDAVNPWRGRVGAIGGGYYNLLSGEVGTIAGGYHNRVLGYAGAIGGGFTNGAAGAYATVPGGSWNHADGANSFAAGRHAHADHNGSFVWGDHHPTWDGTSTQDVKSWADNTFSARATGGFWFGGMGSVYPHATNISGRFINTSTGAYLSDTGNWSNNSDKTLKENFENVNARDILKKVAALSITKWSYKAEGNKEVRHLGPVAQDFSAAFGLGQSDRHISTVDGDGIALAAIQGLNQVIEEKDDEIKNLEKRLQKLEALVNSIK